MNKHEILHPIFGIPVEDHDFLTSLPGFKEAECSKSGNVSYLYERDGSSIKISKSADGIWKHSHKRELVKNIGNMKYSSYSATVLTGVSFDTLRDTLTDILNLNKEENK